ncbi:YcxB family protein [Kitasatospora sp. NPDC096140]|uniref:YcxB family protein n=1 Tax=Kitasatospora sp. NPDC096140 TaxID=3155425 RepID=UPI003324DA47
MDQERMELAYAPTGEDFREAIAAHARHTTVGRVVRVAVWVPAAVAALGCALGAASGATRLSDVGLVALLAATALFAPRSQVLSAHRRAQRRGGRYRAVVDGTGVSVTDARGTRVMPWARVPRSLETEHLFVVLNRSGNCLVVLPKRATSAPDALRALLARHTTPAGGAMGGGASVSGAAVSGAGSAVRSK